MISLGIEGTAHTVGIGIMDEDRILADARNTYQPPEGAGIHPRESARFIGGQMKNTLDQALNEAHLEIEDIDLISFSRGPGLGPCLRTTATAARALALHYNLPILGVNHCVAHIEIGKLYSDFIDPLTLYVSGANTQILKLKNSYYRVFGETLDIGIGNMLDKFGRKLSFPHPSGPHIEELATKGEKYLELPYVVKGTDLSFSGILTSALQKTEKNRLEDVCFSLQETAFAMLTEVTERALAHFQGKEVLLTGGVGNNKRLQEMLSIMAQGQKAKFAVPEDNCSDNGVMIAYLGLLMYKSGVRQELDETKVKQDFRTDQVKITW